MGCCQARNISQEDKFFQPGLNFVETRGHQRHVAAIYDLIVEQFIETTVVHKSNS